MNIKFSNDTIRHICNTESAMLSAYGKACSRFLKMRLLQLFAAEYLGIFSPPGSKPLRCIPCSKQLKKFQIPLGENYILIFEAIDGGLLADKSGLDWNSIKSIVIHRIEEITHD